MTTAAQVIAEASKWVGLVEVPNNRTPFGRWYGMDGQPWCAMAVSYWSFHAGLPIPASTAKGYAYTPSGANWFRSRGRWGTTPRVGAHVFFRFSGDRIHHVGLVTGVNRDGTIDTIEGNTSAGSAGSQRDGGGVWRRRRGRAGIVGYGYPDYSGPGPGPGPTPTEEDDDMGYDFDTTILQPGEKASIPVPPPDESWTGEVWVSYSSSRDGADVRAMTGAPGRWRGAGPKAAANFKVPAGRHFAQRLKKGDQCVSVDCNGPYAVGVLIEVVRR